MTGKMTERLSRRKLLKRAAAASVPAMILASPVTDPPRVQSPEFSKIALSPEDDTFLEELERANFLFFWEQADPETGLVKDRAHARVNDTGVVASIASTGFGLTALCIGAERGYIAPAEAHKRVITTLHFLWEKMPTHRGFFYHFANVKTGQRVWDSEVSSIDTAILLCGILTCREHFRKPEIVRFANDIFNRVEWTWLSEDTHLLPHGWSPETGFLPYRWDYYSELMMMYLLGLGSLTHPLPAEAWHAWNRVTFEYAGIRYIGSYAPLFVHQYSQAWFDFRGKRDGYIDYFKNSILATKVHKIFCLQLGRKFPDYSEDLWGITASDSQNGYVAWGGPPQIGPIDGTVVPSAAAGSLPFLPEDCLRVLKNIRKRYEAGAWSRYGFVNAFNPLKSWFDTDVVAIDTGITMLMAENLRTGFVWKTFMKSREAQRGLDRAGFYSF
ncbi:MAG: hypothetical protein JO185_27560 [Acidobacteriaceae bacterium]|nr:hypothetical protein [Acidobacteriaceae bacterium]MBV9680122.1 hypothetical protein [Acidobacteriaceae bacterium]